MSKDDLFKFIIPLKNRPYGYFQVFKKNGARVLVNAVFEAGDNINMICEKSKDEVYTYRFSNYKYAVSGKGSYKYLVDAKMDSAWMSVHSKEKNLFDQKYTFNDVRSDNIDAA